MKVLHLSEKESLSIATILLNRQHTEKEPTEKERETTEKLVSEIYHCFGVRYVEEPDTPYGWRWRKSI